MSKAWYYEAMGSELGPVSSADLIEKAKRGQIQPDTRVRSGKDGKWQFAERVRGLFPAPPPVVEAPLPAPAEVAPKKSKHPATIPLAGAGNDDDRTYHFTGEATHQPGQENEASESTFEFFEFIGFRQAISSPLFDVLMAYSKAQHLSVTQITRRALAEFLDRKDLAEDKPSGTAEAAPVAVDSTDHEATDPPVPEP